ncbi:unnamed protein product [Ceutorhynchus assimilis]|uniref:Glucose-methanol-choline oxidoreductase N-terminal domain-containing protein n=1 Tax=Ceutorhynchus assimilis TaxID=467358 RepID=A0A9N9MJE4_9CUCU|nr:unnamed protein product [Ceutorhynchus assimilis]
MKEEEEYQCIESLPESRLFDSLVGRNLAYLLSAHAIIPNFDELYKETEDLIKLSKTFQRLENNDKYFANFDHNKKPLDYGTFDFIVVGGGTAGGIVANRLSETSFRVLLVEAGPQDPDTVKVPALGSYFYNTPWDWGYNITEQDKICLAHAIIPNFDDLYRETEDLIKLSGTFQRLKNNDEYFVNFDDNKKPLDYGTFEYIVVGAGTAGGIVANRLSESNSKVLLVEAGPRDPDTTKVPALGTFFFYTPWDWGYNITKQDKICLATIDKRCIFPRGKMWGGTSSLNGNVYSRGTKWDYDTWAEIVGNPDWSYENVLPYFKKAETARFKIDLDKSYHGFDGPQFTDLIEDTPGLTKMLLRAFKERGSIEVDYNGRSPYGVSRVQNFLDRNVRAGTAHSYIRPAAGRPNLLISDNSLVTKVIIANDRAVGIEFVKNGKLYFAQSSKEVILAAGAINTPQILMLSGIGPSEELKKHGIKLVKALPVGQNLQDHVSVFPLFFRTNHTYYNLILKEQLKSWYENRRPLTGGWGIQVVNFRNLKNDRSSKPDIEFITVGPPFLSSTIATANGFNEEYTSAYQILNQYTDFTFDVVLLHPESKGEVTLQSKDPRDYPLINPNYFAAEKDLETIYQSIKWLLEIKNTEAFKNFKAERLLVAMPGCDENYKTDSRNWWYCVIKHLAFPGSHVTGSAIMGTCPSNSVTNPELKVHGIRGLRIADASVIPVTISGHTTAPTVMVAEKVSDLIKAEHGQ